MMYYRVVVFSAPLQGHMLHCKGCCGSVSFSNRKTVKNRQIFARVMHMGTETAQIFPESGHHRQILVFMAFTVCRTDSHDKIWRVFGQKIERNPISVGVQSWFHGILLVVTPGAYLVVCKSAPHAEKIMLGETLFVILNIAVSPTNEQDHSK